MAFNESNLLAPISKRIANNVLSNDSQISINKLESNNLLITSNNKSLPPFPHGGSRRVTDEMTTKIEY